MLYYIITPPLRVGTNTDHYYYYYYSSCYYFLTPSDSRICLLKNPTVGDTNLCFGNSVVSPLFLANSRLFS